MAWQFAWLRSWDEVWEPSHLARWQAAFAPGSGAAVTPYMHPDLVRAWLRTVGRDAYSPYFFWASHPDGRQAFYLLVRARADWRRGFARTMLAAGGTQFDYDEPVVLPAPSGDAALDRAFWTTFEAELRRRQGTWFDTLRLPCIRAPRFGGAALGVPAEVSSFVRLDAYADFDAYIGARKRSFRRELQRRLRRAEAAGRLRFRMHPPEELDTVLGWIPTFIAEKVKRYPSKKNLSNPEDHFYNLALEGLGSVVRYSSLSLDDRPIAWELGYCLNGIYYSSAVAFDTAFGHLAPGHVFTWHLFDWMYRENIHTCDFITGEQDYKAYWTDGATVPTYSLELKSRRPASLLRRGMRGGLHRLASLQLLPGRRVAATEPPETGHPA